MKSNILHILILGFILVQLVSPFSLSDQKQYDPKTYASAMMETQQQFQSKVEEIKQEINEVKNVMANTSITNKVKIVNIAQGMADQRNSLYDMQQILKIPFELRQCKCANLSKEGRAQISSKIDSISEKITNMRASLKKCNFNKCPRYQQLALELSQSQNYLSIMNETINSQCCKGPYKFIAENATGLVNLQGTIYKDNLNAKNWFYGDITEKDYILQRFEYSTKYNLTSCPIDYPYADLTENKCGKCPKTDQYFNLGSRKCLSCDSGTHFFNLTSGKCESCPAETVFNPKNKTCIFCNMTAGKYLNTTSYTCQSCPAGQYYSIDKKICVDCPNGSHFDSRKGKCVRCPNETYFIQSQNACLACPSGSFYNSFTKSCSKCPNGTFYNSTIGRCLNTPTGNGYVSCPHEYPYYNSYTKMCDRCNYDETFNKQSNACVKNQYISICPPSKPIFNPNTLNCIPCPSDSHFDINKRVCINPRCKQGQFLNAIINQCQSPSGICGPDQIYNTQTQKCVSNTILQNNENEGKCEIDEIFDITTNQCILKSSLCRDTQYYSNSSHSCVTGSPLCHVNQYYDKATKSCQPIANLCVANGTTYDLQSGLCLPTCPSGYFYNRTSSQCQQITQIPIPNPQCQIDQTYLPQVKLCVKTSTTCKDNQWYNSNSYKCKNSTYITSPYVSNLLMQSKPFSSYEQYYKNQVNQYISMPNAIKDCPKIAPYYDPSTKGCITCPTNSPLFNLETNKCAKCGVGYIYNPSNHQCISNN